MKSFLKVVAFLILVLPFFFGSAGPAYAQNGVVDISDVPKLPDYSSELSEEDFLEQSTQFHETPVGDDYIAYIVRLPEGWSEAEARFEMSGTQKEEFEDANISRRIMGPVARYFGVKRVVARSKFEVYAESLDFDISAKSWFLHQVLDRGYVLQGLKEYSSKRIEVQYVVYAEGASYVVRSVIEINGPRIVTASYYCPEITWPYERAYQQRSVKSFRFLSPEETKIEMTKTYAFLDLLRFEYPSTWRIYVPNIRSIEQMDASIIYSKGQNLDGQMHISVVSKRLESGLINAISDIKTSLRERALAIGDIIDTKDDYKKPPHVHYNHVERYVLSNEERERVIDHEFWLAILEEDRYYYVVTMITPSRNNEYFAWARNEEAFQTVVESFSP